MYLQKLIVTLFLIFSSFSAFSQQYDLNNSNVEMKFFIKNAGIWTQGTFKEFEGKVQWVESDWTKMQAKFKVKVESIDTGIGLRDKHLKGSGYFDVATYPFIQFESSGVKRVNDQYVLVGKIKIKDVTKGVEIRLRWEESKNALWGKALLNRRDFGVGGNSLTLSDEVEIDIYWKPNTKDLK